MFKISGYLLSAFMLVNASAHAGSFILNDYNVVTIGDLTFESHIAGKTFVGGDLNGYNSPNFADQVDQSSIDASLQVAGNVNLSSSISVKGHMEVSADNTITAINSSQTKVNGQYINNVTSVTVNNDLDAEKVAIENELKSASTAFATLATNTNNTITTDSNNKVTLSVDETLGANDYAVFDVNDITDIFNTSNNLSIEMEANNIDDIAGIIINVTGESLALSSSANMNGTVFNNYKSKILWNFIDATSIDLASQKFFGSILAPFAELTTNQDIDGSVGVYSIAAAKEIHAFETTVTPPDVVQVPTPSVLFLMSIFGLALAVNRRRSI